MPIRPFFPHRNTGTTSPQQCTATTRSAPEDLSVKIVTALGIGGFVDGA